jgi:hypothetical protein
MTGSLFTKLTCQPCKKITITPMGAKDASGKMRNIIGANNMQDGYLLRLMMQLGKQMAYDCYVCFTLQTFRRQNQLAHMV